MPRPNNPPCGAYLRVSTKDQDERNQEGDVVALAKSRGWDPVIYTDHGKSGATTARRAYQEMMDDARRGKLKAIVVWKLDRLGRSVKQLVDDMDNLRAWNVDLVSVKDPIDTTSAFGKAMFQLIAVFAELERNIISERTQAAYDTKEARARNLGQKVRWGRKRAEVPEEAVALALGGMSGAGIARELGISRRVAGYAVEAARNRGAQDGGPFPSREATGTKSTDFVQAGGEQ